MQNSKCKVGLLQKINQDLTDQLEKEGVISLEGSNNDSGKILTVLGLNKKYKKILWIVDGVDEAARIAIKLKKTVKNVDLFQVTDENDESGIIKLTNRQKLLNRLTGKNFQLVVTDVYSLFQKIPSWKIMKGFYLSSKNNIIYGKLTKKLAKMSYRREERVILEGDYSVRGDIIDVFSPQYRKPQRIEFFGDEIEKISLFEPSSGEKIKNINSLTLLPLKSNSSSSILEYFKNGSLIIFDQPDKISAELQSLNIVDKYYPKFIDLQEKLRKNNILYFQPLLGFGLEVKSKEVDYFRPPIYNGEIKRFLFDAKNFQDKKYSVYISTADRLKIEEFFNRQKINYKFLEYNLPSGLISKKYKIAIYTDREIFGPKIKLQIKTPTQKQLEKLKKIKPGELIVHADHGIGKMIKVAKYSFSSKKDPALYVFIEFAGGDRLYLPASRAEKISKYIGISGSETKLSKLGSVTFKKIKEKIKKSAERIAREIIQISAIRSAREGFVFRSNYEWENELIKSFEHRETKDQLKAIEATYKDMKSKKSMDRLICGDVGFGKTEVAIRASARAIANNKQVAVICPTTILTEQHLATFKKRLKKLPIKLESISRLKTKSAQNQILKNLKSGKIDLIIGTHRLLQKDIAFADLGLVIIDEEQRFGVRHKEKLKKLRSEVDILTLSATPIPRTLYLALGGIKNISTIQTPPKGRLPIKTQVQKDSKKEIKKAILKEIKRKGQVYFIHNRVRDIYLRAQELERMLPKNIKIGVVHGQIPAKKLVKIMADFTSKKFDVLLTTTIVENGLDLSNVNTLIVDAADRFGLSELYQLRGRVGRGDKKAFAHFFIKGDRLTKEARRRLTVLIESKDLGSGFMIATRDLELRGGGNLLGREQSGHISEVGLNLYSRILKQAVKKLKS